MTPVGGDDIGRCLLGNEILLLRAQDDRRRGMTQGTWLARGEILRLRSGRHLQGMTPRTMTAGDEILRQAQDDTLAWVWHRTAVAGGRRIRCAGRRRWK